METLERILNLLKNKKIQQKDFVKNIGLNSSAVTDWKSGQSKSYRTHAYKIAEYFNVSVDYLLCKTDDPTPPGEASRGWDDGHTSFYEGMDLLTDDEREEIMDIINLKIERRKNKEKEK